MQCKENKPLDYARTRRSKLKILDYDSDNADIVEKKVKYNHDKRFILR